jgi:hypothetical protein
MPTLEDRGSLLVLADCCIDNESAQAARALKDLRVEASGLEEQFEFAWLRRIKMGTQPINGYGQRRDAVGPKSARPEETVLDLYEPGVPVLKPRKRRSGRLGPPNRNWAPALGAFNTAHESERRGPAPEKWSDMSLLPKSETEATIDRAIGIDEISPEAAKLDRTKDVHHFARERILER